MPTPSALAHEAAQAYIDRGYQVVPVVPGEKRPAEKDWVTTTFSADYFADRPKQSIGLKFGSVSGNLVDVDIDSDVCAAAAPFILAPTGMVGGRSQRPRTHWFYRLDACPEYRPFVNPLQPVEVGKGQPRKSSSCGPP